jgi:DNA end-binding protein Ku
MSARAMYRAVLRVGRESVAVKLYSAVQDERVHFHLLHVEDLVRVEQRMAHPATGETVPSEEIVRGIEVEPGLFVRVDDEELAALEPEPSRDVLLSHWVPADALDHRWYERPYLLGPERGQGPRYAALAAALADSGRIGVAHWTMRKRQYDGALRLEGEHLALVTLRPAEEVLPLEELPAPEGRPLAERERALAGQLVAALAGDFDPEELRDEYRARVLDLVEKKRRGKKVHLKRFRPEIARDDALVAALERSIRRAG